MDEAQRTGKLLSTVATLVVAAALALPTTAAAMSADEAFADGNRLFRDDLYWAALLRYQQAADAGMDTPLLHYNVGIAHYKARQFERARAAFLKAAQSPQLEVIAHYNLGLTAYANGDDAEALRWFRKAREQERSKEIRKLANKAIARLRDEALRPDPEPETPVVTAEEQRPVRELERDPRPFSTFDVYARAGFGSDNNVYRSPAESYVDISNPNNPVQVDPIVQSGSFVPVSFGAKYQVNSFQHESFFGRYRGSGRFYSDELLKNADEYIHELAIGTEYDRREEERRSRVFSAFTIAQHKETWFDPDTGVARRSVDDEDLSDRLSYLRYGPEIYTRQSWERFTFALQARAQLWNYENTGAAEYDHEYFEVGGHVQYRFAPTSLLRLYGEGRRRAFSDRLAFDLNGNQLITNENLEYYYVDAGVLARQRVTRFFWFGVKYERTHRIDQFVGYNDYVRNSYGAELHFRFGDRFRLDADAIYRIYDFENAFAFHNPAAERKTLETADGNIRAIVDMAWNTRLVGEYTYRDVVSNDTRIDYDRSLIMLSLQWDYE